MNDTVGHGYAVWLMPEGKAKVQIREIIDGLAFKYKSTSFNPHVTLIGSVQADEPELLEGTKSIAQGIKRLKLDFSGFSQSDKFFKTVFAEVKKTEQLQGAYDLAAETFKVKKSDFMPHLSLIYAKIDEKQRIDVISSLDKEMFTGLKGVYANALHLYCTDGAVRDWYEAGRFEIKP